MAQALDPHFFSLQEALAGKYSLEAEIGRGGMGIVYLALEVRLDRPVALKVLPQELSQNPGVRDRFLREARTAAKLSHPNIVPIFAVDEVEQFVYFAMAYGECRETRFPRICRKPVNSPRSTWQRPSLRWKPFVSVCCASQPVQGPSRVSPPIRRRPRKWETKSTA